MDDRVRLSYSECGVVVASLLYYRAYLARHVKMGMMDVERRMEALSQIGVADRLIDRLDGFLADWEA